MSRRIAHTGIASLLGSTLVLLMGCGAPKPLEQDVLTKPELTNDQPPGSGAEPTPEVRPAPGETGSTGGPAIPEQGNTSPAPTPGGNPSDGSSPGSTPNPNATPDPLAELMAQADHFQKRYGLDDASEKIVDNVGDGFAALYGMRNMRVVLHGVLYRGGANNRYHKTTPRANQNPLPADGLENLCNESFGTAIYLYSTNYKTAPPNMSCVDAQGNPGDLAYLQHSPYRASDMKLIFQAIVDIVAKPSLGPLYIHCWNGWHASGLASAYVLRQFCGVSGADAVKYWDKNTDGNDKDPAFKTLRQQILDFVPDAKFVIPDTARDRICPVL